VAPVGTAAISGAIASGAIGAAAIAAPGILVNTAGIWLLFGSLYTKGMRAEEGCCPRNPRTKKPQKG
jgi:hypothetical protein